MSYSATIAIGMLRIEIKASYSASTVTHHIDTLQHAPVLVGQNSFLHVFITDTPFMV